MRLLISNGFKHPRLFMRMNKCEACGRVINHSGFCFPCNIKRKKEHSAKASPTFHGKHSCDSCGFSTYYKFTRCPECNTKAKDPLVSHLPDAPTSHDTGLDILPEQPDKFVFPFASVRESQKEMIADVAKIVAESKHLVADAPTGLGKTIAVLFPAVEYAVANGLNVFFLTSRLSQHKAAIETLKLMKNKKFKAIDIVGKKHLCSQDVTDMDTGMFNNYCSAMIKDKRCAYYKNSHSADLAIERGRIMGMLGSTIATTEESIRLAGGRYCTYEVLMDAAKNADVIVGDYFHLFGMHEKFMKRMGKNLSDTIIIVDEAHNLSSRIRNHLSSKISTRSCDLAAKEAQKFAEFEARSIIHEIDHALTALGKKLFGKKEVFIEREDFLEKISVIGNYDELIAKLTTVGQQVLEEKKISHVDKIAEFLQLWKREGIGYTRIISREKIHDKEHIAVQFSCLDPSIISKEIVQGSHSTILMSGTLSPMEMYRDLLGLEPNRTIMKSYSSPFPKENRKNIIVKGVTTKYTERTPANYEKMARLIGGSINAVSGNAAVFFPSYDMRDKLTALVKTNKHTILEKSTMTKKERDEVKEELRKHKAKGAVLYGVMGGSFSEGIDLPGDLLNGVIIVGLPLERPDLSVEALIAYYEQRFQKGRDYGYNFPAMIKVMQASGRCIRNEEDRGVIVFMDERFLWTNYKLIFPRDWAFTITEKPEDEIRKFWEGK